MSVATIYRYFPSKDDLLAAAAEEPSRLALASADRPVAQPGDDEFAVFLRAMWHEFSGNLPLLRHQISSESGREMRRARLDDGRDRLSAYVTGFGVDPSSVEGERLISLIMLISGSIAFVELHDGQGIEVDDAMAVIEPGDVVITRCTAPSWNAILALAGAVVTTTGGLVSHAAVIARELNIPAVIGDTTAFDRFSTGMIATLDPETATVTSKGQPS